MRHSTPEGSKGSKSRMRQGCSVTGPTRTWYFCAMPDSTIERCQAVQGGMPQIVCLEGERYFRRAVTSISMRMRGSSSSAEIMVAAGRTLPRYSRRTGQHGSKSSRLGRM